MLFALSPDRAHDFGQWIFRKRLLWRLLGTGVNTEALVTTLAGRQIIVPVGLAAGFDKDGDLTYSMTHIGFGFITVGSVTEGDGGNPRPWFRRVTSEEGMINSMGLPSKGPDHVERNLTRLETPIPIVVSVAAKSVSGYLEISTRLSKHAVAIEFNMSCPNLPKGNYFDEDVSAVEELLDEARTLSKPIFLKLPPYDNREIFLDVLEIAHKQGVRGLTIANTKRIREPTLPLGYGGLSGRPLFKDVKAMVETVYEQYGEEFEIVATGGIFTGREAYEVLGHGARAVGILTALIYHGPGVVKRICSELAVELVENGFKSVDELRGTLVRK